MDHPFVNNLGEKTLEELQETLTKLMTKLTFAHRTGNRPLINQLQMVIESYKNQHKKKMDELFEKQKLNTKINIDK
jgi:iron-sulfur cluster repair protein YtfE (RIC family)